MKTTTLLVLILIISGCSRIFVTPGGREISYQDKKYKVIQAGNQYWMAENLATESYRNGKKVPLLTDYRKWPEMKSPACGYYNNDTA